MDGTRARNERATLDGLRGVAAFAVVLMHAGALAPRAYLAVDLFFLLSGFVLEHAYGARLAEGWHPLKFLHKRVARLYPLYALAIAIAVAAVGSALLLHRTAGWTWDQFALAAAAGIVMLPAWLKSDHRLYALDFPAWTLLAELVVNLAWAAVYRWLNRWTLIAWIGVAAGVLTVLGLDHGSLNGGADWETAPLGFARAFFAFPVGVLLRRGTRGPLPAGAGLLALALAALVLYLPGVSGPGYDLAVALALWPAVIAVGAAGEARGPVRSACIALGAVSFAAYVTAVPIYALVHAALKTRGLQGDLLPPWLAVSFAVALFAGCLAVRRFARRPD
jgi:peptidoglycan/LPS O-acetylase OafA/YrhL